VIVGMGGSAIGADIASTLARISSPIAVEIVRNYHAPPTTAGTLTIASSVSGNTEETLAAFEAVRQGPGMHLAITGGGELASLEVPQLQYEWEFHPRAALGWGLMPLAAVLTRLGVLAISDAEVVTTANAIDNCSAEWATSVPTSENLAKQIASRLRGQLPVFAGTDFLDVAARRWAGQAQENAKQWAFATAIPEMNHNFLNGFGLPDAGTKQLHVLFLDALSAHERSRQRVELTGQSLTEAGVAHSTQVIGGGNPLESVLRACALGDWVSYYLAMLNGVDPSDTGPIETFKQRMG
jgi:glucose/mannose-6-phosphate isomerase